MLTDERLTHIAEAAKHDARVKGETILELIEEVRRQRRMIDHLLDLRRPAPAWMTQERRKGTG